MLEKLVIESQIPSYGNDNLFVFLLQLLIINLKYVP